MSCLEVVVSSSLMLCRSKNPEKKQKSEPCLVGTDQQRLQPGFFHHSGISNKAVQSINRLMLTHCKADDIQILTTFFLFCGVCRLAVRIFPTKKDRSHSLGK